LDLGNCRARDQQQPCIEQQGVLDVFQDEIAPFIDLLGLLDVLNQRDQTPLKTTFIRREDVVGGHDVADG